MKLVFSILILSLIFSCNSEKSIHLLKKDSITILNQALASRTFLQEQLSHKKFDTIYFVKGKLLPSNANLNQDYFNFFYIDSTQNSTRPSRIFFAPDKRIWLGVKKFVLKNDTVYLNLRNYGAEFTYLFKYKYVGKSWRVIHQNSETGY